MLCLSLVLRYQQRLEATKNSRWSGGYNLAIGKR
jgi:hypothetical protein